MPPLFIYNIQNCISHNVPVVNDGLTARIRACEARPGLANCGGVRRGSERSDRPSRTEPEPPSGGEAFTILLSEVGAFFTIFFVIVYCFIMKK